MGSDNGGLTPFQSMAAELLRQYGRTYEEFLGLVAQMPQGYIRDGQFGIDRAKASDKVSRDDFIKRLTLFLYDLKAHPNDANVVFCKRHSESKYEPCSQKDMHRRVAKLWDRIFGCTPVSEISSCVKNIFMSVDQKADVRNRVFCVCDGMYFIPGAENNLFNSPEDTAGCFYTLQGPYSVFTADTSYKIKEYYDKFLAELLRGDRENKQFEDFYKELPVEFEWLKLWANEPVGGWQDRYWDILISHSTPFFKRLIEKSYWYDGPTRSGKSTANSLIRFTFGEDNCGGVTMNEYDDPHFNHRLVYCCVNVPDEEKGGMVTKRGCAIFKTLSAKAARELQVMGSNDPIRADGQFMSFHPTNSNVEWPDGESGPCLKRCLIIFFHNDLSRFDMTGGNFIEDTFVSNPDEYAKYLGTIFALANYFSRPDKKFFLSPEMSASNDYVAADTDSLGLYYKEFFKYFNGVYNEDFLFDDYKYACREYGWVQQSKAAVRQKFVALLTQKRKPVKLKTTQKSVRCHKLIGKNPHADILCPDYEIIGKEDNPFYGNAEALHEGKMSVVALLKNIWTAEQESKDDLEQSSLEVDYE